MTKKEKDELAALREEIAKLREEVRQSRPVIVPQPYPVYPLWPYRIYIGDPLPYQPTTITWGSTDSDYVGTKWVTASDVGAWSYTAEGGTS